MSKKMLVLALVLVGAFAVTTAGAQSNPWWSTYAGEHSWVSAYHRGEWAGTVLNPEGKGDMLIFPYYETRLLDGKEQQTVFAIINEGLGTTAGGVAAKLRFREWDKSVEVFDIDIWLSINDVWVGTISRSAGDIAQLSTPDYVIVSNTACTFEVSKPYETTPVEFATFLLPVGSSTLYGYFEVIGEELTKSKTYVDKDSGKTLVDRKCYEVETDVYVYSDCPNTLMGYAYIVRIEDGVGLGYTASAFANFYKYDGYICNGECYPAIFSLFAGPGSPTPTLAQCQDTLDEIEFQLSKTFVYVPYAVESAINNATTQLITFPTKHFHFETTADWTILDNTGSDVWGKPFTGKTSNKGEEVLVRLFDRNEKEDTTTTYTSPQPEPGKIKLPYELMLIGFYKGTTTISGRANFGYNTKSFDSGWTRWDLMNNGTVLSPKLNHYAYPHLIWDKFAWDPETGEFLECVGFNLWYWYFWYYTGLPAIVYTIQEASFGGVAFGEMIPTPYEMGMELDTWCEEGDFDYSLADYFKGGLTVK